ncbi:MAG: M48 family metallopeptidase [Kiritimatiellae bacterium]|nr:M48 family metallopeptidase [Kiritimatiellia bacterium]
MAYIHPSRYQHPLDKQLLDKIRGTPGIDVLVRETSAVYNERVSRMELLGNGVLVTERSFPKLKEAMGSISAVLGIKEPDTFVVGNGEPNAYTSGIKNPFIVISQELLRRISPDEAAGILAHECGHIACDHLLWHNVVTTMMAGIGAISKVAATVFSALTPVLLRGYRASEYSADRAAVVALGRPAPIQGGLMKLLTGHTGFESELDIEEICRQADRLDEYLDESTWNRLLGITQRMFLTHPWTIVRIRELHRWEVSGELAAAICDDDGGRIFPDGSGSDGGEAVNPNTVFGGI